MREAETIEQPPRGLPTLSDQALRRLLVAIALGGLTLGGLAWLVGSDRAARVIWAIGTAPVIVGLAVSMIRDLLAGRLGVDAVAFVSMTAALVLGEPLAGAVVALMYSGGNLLEDFAVSRAEKDLKSLIDRAPRVAHHRVGDSIEDIAVEDVRVGDVVVVRAGEVVPVDGAILSSAAVLDESALTGEPIAVTRRKGELARSGTVNAGETFELTATATAGDSTYAAIVRMVDAAQTAKAPFIRIADKFALILLPVTLVLAGAAWWFSGDPIRGLAVLVASTPCPLILAAPVAFVAGVSRAARRGVLIKGGTALEALASVHTVMFDKTGTLTVGGARLVAIETAPGENADEVLRLAASLEQASHHVVAGAIVEAAKLRGLELTPPEGVRETLGSGLQGSVGGSLVKAGSFDLVADVRRPEAWAVRALRRASWRSALSVFVARDGKMVGAILLADELRRETPRAIRHLRSAGIKRIVMVTGDRSEAAETIGAALDIEAVLADRTPADKVQAVAVEQRQHPTLMVGDGINDAPALAAADVGVAMGARGASASSEAADVVVLIDRLDCVSEAVEVAKRAKRIALQSIYVGLALSGLAMVAAAFGYLSPVAGALSQELIDVAVILNALRALSAGRHVGRDAMLPSKAQALRRDHQALEAKLDRLREIADALDTAEPAEAHKLILEADRLVEREVATHERDDEEVIYPNLQRFLRDGHGLAAMSRAHREILHLSRLLTKLASDIEIGDIDRYLIRDAQRVIESIESLVRIHNAQEEDIYDHAASN